MKNLNLFKSNVSGMDREWIENGSGLTRHHGKLWKYVAMIFAVLVMSVANVGVAWGKYLYLSTANFDSWEKDNATFKLDPGTGSGEINGVKVYDHMYRFDVTAVKTSSNAMKFRRYNNTGGTKWNEFSVTYSASYDTYKVTGWDAGSCANSNITEIYLDVHTEWYTDGPIFKLTTGGTTYTTTGFVGTNLVIFSVPSPSGTLQFERWSSDNKTKWNELSTTYNSSYNAYEVKSWSSLEASYNIKIVEKGNYIYFDNSQTNWSTSKKYVVIGHDKPLAHSGTYTFTSTPISNTKLWYYNNTTVTWRDATYYAFLGSGSNFDTGDWGSSNLSAATKYTGAYTDMTNLEWSKLYLFKPASGSNGAALSLQTATAASGLNNNQTVKYALSIDGGETFTDMSSGKTPGQISISAYKFSDGTYTSVSNSSNSQSISGGTTGTYSASVPAACTGNTTYSYTSTQTGYSFVGWYDGSTQISTNSSFTANPNTAKTITARYKATQVTVTLNGNSGTGNTASVTATYGVSTLPSITNPTRDGYVFAGWFTGTGGTGKLVIDIDGSLQPGISGFTDADGKWIATSNQNVYAGWLTVHSPGVYTSTYGQPLTISSCEAYEVYRYAVNSSNIYVNAGGESAPVTTTDARRLFSFSQTTTSGACEYTWSGWIGHTQTYGKDTETATASGEFKAHSVCQPKCRNQQGFIICVTGYSEFSIYAKDNATSGGQNFKVFINGVNQSMTLSKSWTVRRFALTPANTYVIRVTGQTDNNNQIQGFSLKVPCPAYTLDRRGQENGTYTVGSYDGNALTCTPSVSGTYTYQWKQYMSGQGVGDTINAVGSGANTNSFTPNPASAGTYYYMCRVLNVCGDKQVTSTTGTFTFNAAPSCSAPAAPTNFAAGSISATGATFTITDAADAASYDIYYSIESTAPTSGTAATTTSTSKTKEVTGLTAGTTYYAWVRSVCDASHKSAWVALNPGGDTHTFATSCVAPTAVNISGTYHYFPGETISLTAAAEGGSGTPTTYQWYKGGTADGNIIEGATSATYTKATCTFADAGSYYCKVTRGGSCSTFSGNYDVKILRLYVNGSINGDPYRNVDFVKVDGTTATASISLGSGRTYGFNIADGCGHHYGNYGTMQYNNYGPWTTDVPSDCGLTTTNAGTYIFTINYSNLSSIKTSVTFPVVNQAAGKVIYFDNNVLKWTGSSIYYRIGNSSHSQADQLSLVPGTANLYKMTTREYNGFFAWQIGNAAGGNGSIYNTKNTPAITASIAYEGGAVTAAAVTVTPGEDHSTGGDAQNNNCEFYSKTITSGMKTDRVTISDCSNGTITVNYTNTSNVASTLTSGYADLAHTVILTSITAVPATGYEIDDDITINEDEYSANYVVTGPTTIAASFKLKNYNVTYSAPDNGDYTIKVGSGTAGSETKTANYENTITLAATPSSGYAFSAWTITNSSTSADVTTTLLGDDADDKDASFTMPAYGVTVTATFEEVCSGPDGSSATFSSAGYTYDQGDDANEMSLTGMAASGGGALSYQWYKTTSDVAHGEPISGATSNTYTPSTSVAHVANWYYYCVVTEAGCATTYTTALSGAIVVNPSVCYNLTLKTDGSAGNVAQGTSITTSNYAGTLTGGIATIGGSKSTTAYSAGANGGFTLDDNGRQIDVDLDYLTQVGSIITVKFYLSGSGSNYGLKINGQSKWTVSGSSGSQTISYTLTGSDTELVGQNHLTIARNAGSPVFQSITISNCSGTEAPCFTISDAAKNGSTDLSADTITNAIIDGTVRGGQVKRTGSSSYNGNDSHGIIFDDDNDELTITLWGDKALEEGSVISITQHGNSSTSMATGFKISGLSMTPATYTNSEAYEENTQTYTVPSASDLIGKQSFTIKWTGTNQVYLKSMNITGCGEVSCSAPTSADISGGGAKDQYAAIELTASASGTNESTTYTWYRGNSGEAAAKAAGAIQATATSGSTYSIASCEASDAAVYYCVISNGTGCEVTASTSISVTPRYYLTYDKNTTDEVSNMPDRELHTPNIYTLSSKVPTRAGYTFSCWNRNQAGTGDCFNAGASFTTGALDETLYAKWTPNDYTITYHLNGASWASSAGVAEYTCGTGATLPVAGDMTNTGYTFGGWYANSGLTGSSVTTIGTSEYGNKEFWAKWTENTYTVTYSANGGTGTTSSTNGHYVTVATNGFTAPSGKVFVGWNTASGGDGDSYGEGDEIELTGNMTLYAIWATDYDISWGNAQYGGADETPNLGGGNYTITASVATWTGTLTTDMISAVSDGVTITNVAVDNSASPKTITATFNVGASVAGTTIKMQLDVPAYGVYGAKSSEKSITIDRCSGGGGASTVVFSQNFSSDGAGSVAYAANTAREYKSGGTTITGIVGSGTNEFTYIGQVQKSNAGVAVNSSTGGNSVNATGIFQAYCNNTGGKYALVKNSNFAATAPTALKVSMKIWFQQGSSSTGYSVTFAVGDGFSNSTSAPDATNVHSGFSILNNSNACLYPYKSNKTALSGTNKLTQGSDLTMVWVINNSGQTLSYTDPASNTSTLANDKFDVWVGTTRFIAGASATTASKTLQNLYIGDPAGKNHQLRLDDIVVTDISPAVSSITPTLTWDDGALDIANDGVTKEEGDADFTFTASQNKNSLGAITYGSSNTSVATVNASGKVHIVGNGTTTITASIAESGCYKDADVSYSLTVNEKACADAAGTIKDNDGNTIDGNAITKSSCETVTLKLVGYTDDADIQWYKDGEEIYGATDASYTVPTSGSGVYSAISSKTCDRNSTNEITVTNSASVSATKIVDSWYVKAGRRTPDIALVQTMDAASFQVKISSTVIWSTVSGSEVTTGLGGCGFYLGKDGIIYLKGTKSNGNATDDILENKTLSFVVTNACGTNASDPGNITIIRQAATDRPSVAYVSLGTKGGAVTDTTAGYYKTAALYKYLDHTLGSGAFDLTAQNIYWTTNEKMLREHYSQFDAILITDDPSTKTVPSGVSGDGAYQTKGYVNALGCLVDIRPILTMEAYVSALANWKTKGINGDPTSPNPRQYSMKLQCKDHEIFGSLSVGDNVVQTTVDGTNYWSVKMVDNTKSPYSGLADDEKTSGKGSIPALQGFAASDVSGLLLLGQISDGAYHAGVERQEEPAARLMLLGLNNQALPNALTQEGKIVIKNALTYLLKTNMEEVDDCSNYFTGATSTDWNTPSNWFKGVVPNSPMVRARILAPCEITGITVKAAQIDIVTSGTSSKKAGELTGKLTINPTGALIVGGKIRAAEAPYFSIENLKPTEEEDLVLNTNSSNQAALIFDNEDGDTKATVNLYSLGRKSGGHYQFQYYAVPMDYVSVSESFAGSDIYTYVWHEATGWERRGYYTDLYAFEGVGITTKLAAPKTYTMKGALASTATKEITLTIDDDGYNLIGNSWTAPIQISQLEEDNSSLSNKTVYIYNAGNDTTAADGYGTTAGQWTAIPFNAVGFSAWDGLKVIPAMQAFEIVPDEEETLTLDYEKVVRGDNQTLTEKLHAPRRVADHAGIELMRIRVADSKTHTDLHLFEGERFSDEFDNGWEAAYMDGDDGTTKLYADVALGRMAVVATDELEGTLLGFAPGKETEYTFSFGGEGMGYYLNDLKLMKSTLINEEATYSFTFEEGDTNRFYISRTPIEAPQTPTGVDNTRSGEVKAQKFIYNDKMYIMINGRVYSAEGQIVK